MSAADDRRGIDSWFPRLREGMWIKVEGERVDGGILRATEIKILYGELDEWEIESYIASIDPVRLQLGTTLGVEVLANAKTRFEGPKDKKNVTFAFFEVDDRVEIEGQLQNDGTFLAESIDIDKSKRLRPNMVVKNEHEIRARVDSIDADAHRVVLMGITVQFDDRTKDKSR